MNKLILAAIRCSLTFLLPAGAYAISAQWDLDPISSDWNSAANWTPMGIPNGPADIATFALSNTTDVSISADTEVNGITFTPAATNPYTITASPGLTLTISGVGIINNSGAAQNFVTAFNGAGNGGLLLFKNAATAGSGTFFTNTSAANRFLIGGQTQFFNFSTAGNGTFVNNGGTALNAFGGMTEFFDTSSAANGTFTNNGGMANAGGGVTFFRGTSSAANGIFVNNGAVGSGAAGGETSFFDTSSAGNGIFTNNGSTVVGAGTGRTNLSGHSTAGNGTFINNGSTVSGGRGGVILFDFNTTAGNGTFINNGGTGSGAGGGSTVFFAATADSATLIANGGLNGGQGGTILFEADSTGGTSRVEVFGNGGLDISFQGAHRLTEVEIGSLEGDGNAFLGASRLDVGSNNLTTTFSGVIQDGGLGGGTGGSLTKIGTGTLILSGANTYTGNTNVNGGTLQVDGSITSNTLVRPGGSLTGTGNIHGDVRTLHGGTVAPGELPGTPGTLNISGNYGQSAGRLLIEIATASLGDYSVLNVLGTAHLGGTLDPVLLNGFIPTVGEEFTFLNYGSVLGGFSRIEDQTFNNGTEHWAIIYEPTDAILIVRSGPAPIPDEGSTFLLLTLGLLGLVAYRRQLLAAQNLTHR